MYCERHGAADLAALLEALGISRAHVAGYSMGGAVALQLALDRPELVRPARLVRRRELCSGRLLGTTAPGGPAGTRQAQLALLPGTSHEGMLDRVDWLSSMIARFLMP